MNRSLNYGYYRRSPGIGDAPDVTPAPVEPCPIISHLACKLPGELEPRTFDVYEQITVAAGAFLPNQFIDIGNLDAPWHLSAFGFWDFSDGDGVLSLRVYNSRGFGISDQLIRAGNLMGGPNAATPCNPSYVWPLNSSLVFDVQNTGIEASFGLFFLGFKIFDRGAAPC